MRGGSLPPFLTSIVMKSFLILSFSLVISNSFCQTFTASNDIHWGTSGGDIIGNVITTNDGNRLLIGSSTGSNNDFQGTNYGSRDLWLIKIAPDNSIIWEKNYGGSGDDYGIDGVQINSNEFMIIGYSNSPQDGNKTAVNYGGNDVWVLKVDNSGNLIDDFSYGSDYNEIVTNKSIQMINSNKFVICAGSGGGVSGNKTVPNFGVLGTTDIWLLDINSNGSILSQTVLGGDQMENSSTLTYDAQTGRIYVACNSGSGISGNKTSNSFGGFNDVWTVKLDTNLNIINQTLFGGNNSDQVIDLEIFNNNLIAAVSSNSDVSGNKAAPLLGSNDGVLLALDTTTLSISFQNSYGGNSSFSAFLNVLVNSNKIILTGFANGPSNPYKSLSSYGGRDAWLVSFDDQFNYISNITVGGTTDEVTNSIIPIYTNNGTLELYYDSNSPGYTGSLNCANYGSFDIVKSEISTTLEVTMEDNEEIYIYPNPVNDYVHFANDFNGKLCNVYDLNGNIIFSGVVVNNQIDLSNLINGVYFLSIENSNFKLNKF